MELSLKSSYFLRDNGQRSDEVSLGPDVQMARSSSSRTSKKAVLKSTTVRTAPETLVTGKGKAV